MSLSILVTTAVGAIPLVVGFSLQSVLQGMAAGVIMRAERHFHVGQYLTSGPYAGEVESIETRVTMLRKADGTLACVPNAQLLNGGFVIGTPKDSKENS